MKRDVTMQALLDHDVISAGELEGAIRATRGSTSNWLEQLVLLGRLDEEAFCHCLSRVLLVPCCDPRRLAHISRQVLLGLPAEVILEHQVLPVWLDHEGDLHVAMVQPVDSARWDEIQFFAAGQRRLMREIIGPTAMAWALHTYFGLESTLCPAAQHRPQALVMAAQ